MLLAMSASDLARHPFKMTRYAATNVKYNPESQKTTHAKKFFKITPTQEDIYNLLNNTEERPMSSTLSPYAPLPAIGNTFVGPAKNNRRSRIEERKHQVIMETVELKRTKTKNVTKLEAKNKQTNMKKEKSLELGHNHGRHILNIIGLKGKKKEIGGGVLMQKTKKLDHVDSNDSTEVFGTSQENDDMIYVSEIGTKSKLDNLEGGEIGGPTSDTENRDEILNISSDLSALNLSTEKLETALNHESEEFIHNVIKDIEKKSASSKTPLTPKKRKGDRQFTLVRERTYDLLEPKILKSKLEECELDSERSFTRMSGKVRELSHKSSLEPFGPISLEQSTGSIAFGRRLSSMESDVDFERPTTSGSSSGQNTEDSVYNINGNTVDEQNDQTWQLRNLHQRDQDVVENRSSSPFIGMVPRVMELKRSHLDGRPSASRFSKTTDSDQDILGIRNKITNRINSPLRFKSGKVSDSNVVRVLDITPLHLEDSGAYGNDSGLSRSQGKIVDLRLSDVKTPFIDKMSYSEGRDKTGSGKGRFNRSFGAKSQSVDEIDSSIYTMSLDSAVKGRDSRFAEMKTPSIEEIGSFDGDKQMDTDNSVINAISWEINDSTQLGGLDLRNVRQTARKTRLLKTKTPSIEEIGSVDIDFSVQRGKSRGFMPSGVGRRSAINGDEARGRKGRSWNVKTPSIEEISSVDNKVGVSGATGQGRDPRGWDSRTPSIEEIDTRYIEGSRSGEDQIQQEDTQKQKAYWIDL